MTIYVRYETYRELQTYFGGRKERVILNLERGTEQQRRQAARMRGQPSEGQLAPVDVVLHEQNGGA